MRTVDIKVHVNDVQLIPVLVEGLHRIKEGLCNSDPAVVKSIAYVANRLQNNINPIQDLQYYIGHFLSKNFCTKVMQCM